MSTSTLVGAPDPNDNPNGPVTSADNDGPGAEVERLVIDAEIVDDEEDQADDGTAVEVAPKPGGLVRRPVYEITTLARHPRARAAAREGWFVYAGSKVAVNRWRDAHGANRYERRMRAAEAAGDEEALREWEARDVAEKERRHRRVMDWVGAPLQLVKAAAVGAAGLAGLLLALGVILAIANGDATQILGPVTALVEVIAFTVWFLSAYSLLFVSVGTVVVVAWLRRVGREHVEPPAWIVPPAPSAGDQMDTVPDENTIVNALRNLGIKGFKDALKEGWRVQFLMPPTIDGKGYRVQLALPPACPVVEIVKRKPMLSHNLVRFPIEVWITEPKPSVLDLWVAKPGALSGPVDPWPLLADLDNAVVDYFAGVPVGVTIRGDVVRGRLSEANYALGGVMGSGKSTLAINLVLGAMLDPLVDIDVVVMAENADYEPMKPALRSLTTGAGEDTVNACLNMLEALYDELALRGQALRSHDARAVTRAIAAKDARLRPRLMVVDECQNLFMGEHGKTAIEVASKLISTARKYAITLVFLTPEPSKDALPRKILSLTTNKACFAIGDQMGNDAVLGTGSYTSGISAVGLTPKTDEGPGDVGTCMTRGFLSKPGLLRCFYVPQDDAHRVTRRALELRAGQQTAARPAEQTEEADLLTDVAAVLHATGSKRMRTQELLAGLAARNKAAYGRWTFTQLADALPDAAKPYKSGGVKVVAADRIAEALADRDAETDTESDDEEMEFGDE